MIEVYKFIQVIYKSRHSQQPAANGAALSALEDIIIYNLKKIKALLHTVKI